MSSVASSAAVSLQRPTPSLSTPVAVNVNGHLGSNQSHLFAKVNCFLCDLPRMPWTMVRDYGESVCRGCANFEGVDKIQQTIEAVRHMKRMHAAMMAFDTPSPTAGVTLSKPKDNLSINNQANGGANPPGRFSPPVATATRTPSSLGALPTLNNPAIPSQALTAGVSIPFSHLTQLTEALAQQQQQRNMAAAAVSRSNPFTAFDNFDQFSQLRSFPSLLHQNTAQNGFSLVPGLSTANLHPSLFNPNMTTTLTSLTNTNSLKRERTDDDFKMDNFASKLQRGRSYFRQTNNKLILGENNNNTNSVSPTSTNSPDQNIFNASVASAMLQVQASNEAIRRQRSQTHNNPSNVPNAERVLRCTLCQQRLEDTHFVQCPSELAHKFCFPCSRQAIKTNFASAEVYCPSGQKCPLANNSVPWTFMPNEIGTILGEDYESFKKDRENATKKEVVTSTSILTNKTENERQTPTSTTTGLGNSSDLLTSTVNQGVVAGVV
uniref:IRF-2BP1_2 domain-containing protein n=1 Tax=Rhabditophanes sp. KR3021 TaxID=114890 RepID=A0AC35TVI0_9BILA